uniref:uncharacterized protein n=1 Tax=Myxine glutinosa TaxID=7769 RepID=UPI00358FF30F
MTNETYPEEILRTSQVELLEFLPHKLLNVLNRLFQWNMIYRMENLDITTKYNNSPIKHVCIRSRPDPLKTQLLVAGLPLGALRMRTTSSALVRADNRPSPACACWDRHYLLVLLGGDTGTGASRGEASRDLLDLLHGKGAKACAAFIYALRYDFSNPCETRCLTILKNVNWEKLSIYKEKEWEFDLESNMREFDPFHIPSCFETSSHTPTEETQMDNGKAGCASAEGPDQCETAGTSTHTPAEETQKVHGKLRSDAKAVGQGLSALNKILRDQNKRKYFRSSTWK